MARRTLIEELRQRRNAKRRSPTGRKVPRDSWLSPLTFGSELADDAQVHRGGLRASDRGFLDIPLLDYLRLLRWTAKQGSGEVAAEVPQALAGTLATLGIDASMWRDLVWNWQRYFGKSSCAGRPESMQADAEQHGRRWHRGQRAAAACFAG